jgi:hypothetical protein
MTDITDFYGEPIYTYTSEQAIQDGILFKISDIELFKNSIINITTTNLMDKGYWKQENQEIKINISNLQDLLTQAIKHMAKKGKDTFYSLRIELPNGNKTKIFIAQNETGKYTVMLPEDY